MSSSFLVPDTGAIHRLLLPSSPAPEAMGDPKRTDGETEGQAGRSAESAGLPPGLVSSTCLSCPQSDTMKVLFF